MRGSVLFENSIIALTMLSSKRRCYYWLFNLIEEFATEPQAIVGNYSDYIMVVKAFTFGCYYIQEDVRFS
jgi:hypothetical protein